MGMGRVWVGKFEFGEKRFWLLGQVNTQNACPFGHTPMPSISSCREMLGADLPSRFCLQCVLHSWFWSSWELHSRFWSCCAFPIHVFIVSFIFPMTGKSDLQSSVPGLLAWRFCCCLPWWESVFAIPNELEKRPRFLGVCGSRFFPREANEHLVKSILAPGAVLPTYHFWF